MRTREFAAGAIVLLLALMQLNAGPLVRPDPGSSCAAPEYEPRRMPERLKPVVVPHPKSTVVQRDQILATAYYDTMSILSRSNSCSDFFGGSEASVNVFSEFMASVKRSRLPSGIGVRMSGDYMNVLNAQTQLKYRLFETTSINTAGPFYLQKTFFSGARIFGIGSFPPNSREARVLMLLHELGHLMRGADGKWLLPDDGHSLEDSINNTRRVESVCGDQIRDTTRVPDSVRLNSAEQTVSPAAATSSH